MVLRDVYIESELGCDWPFSQKFLKSELGLSLSFFVQNLLKSEFSGIDPPTPGEGRGGEGGSSPPTKKLRLKPYGSFIGTSCGARVSNDHTVPEYAPRVVVEIHQELLLRA